MQRISNLPARLAGAFAVCLLSAPICGQTASIQTTASLDRQTTTTSTGTLAGDAEATQTVLLLGEIPEIEEGRDRKKVLLSGMSGSLLGGRVVDMTSKDASLTSVSDQLADAAAVDPDIVLLIAGAAEAEAKTTDQEQQELITRIASTLSDKGARVYVLPADLNLDTLIVANLRIAGSSAGAQYVEPGSEMTGRPYEQALEEIRNLEQDAQRTPTVPKNQVATPEVEMETTLPPIQPGAEGAREIEPTPGIFSPPRRASTDSLVSSGVGEDGMTTSTFSEESSASSENPRIITKRGAQATETLRMRPMPALKPFEPKRPVPRLDVERKEPGLSR